MIAWHLAINRAWLVLAGLVDLLIGYEAFTIGYRWRAMPQGVSLIWLGVGAAAFGLASIGFGIFGKRETIC
jgi:hypothetical protein